MVAVGGSLGVSYLFKLGGLTLAPSLGGRASSDFGLATLGGPASLLSADVALTLSTRTDDVTVGIAPFFSTGAIIGSRGTDTRYFFGGGWLIGRVRKFEVLAGIGHVVLPSGRSWNVPLLGLRAGDN
jgi:hypothetical protein